MAKPVMVWMEATEGHIYPSSDQKPEVFWYKTKINFFDYTQENLDLRAIEIKNLLLEVFGEDYQDRVRFTKSRYGSVIYFVDPADATMIYLTVKDWENQQ